MTPALDTRTLFAISSGVSVVLAAILAVLWRGNRAMRGLRDLVAGVGAQAPAFLIAGGYVPGVALSVELWLSNTLLVLGAALQFRGVRRLYGADPHDRSTAFSALVAAIVLGWFSVEPHLGARTAIVALSVGGWGLACALTAARGAVGADRTPSLILSASYWLLALNLAALFAFTLAPLASLPSRAEQLRSALAVQELALVSGVTAIVMLVGNRLRETATRAAVELAASEARAHALIRHAPEAIVLLDVSSGRFVGHNPQACALFGRTDEEMSQLGPVALSPERQPDGRLSREKAEALIEACLAGGLPVFEWTHLRADGRPVLCEVRLLRLPDTEPPLLRGSLLDIGERKRLEMERERDRYLLGEALSLAEAGYWIWEPRDGQLTVSPQLRALLGGVEESMPGYEPVRARVHEADAVRVAQATAAALRSGGDYDLHFRIVHPETGERQMYAVGHVTVEAGDRPARLFEVVQDVTETRRLQQALHRAELSSAMASLVAGAAHELRNPLFAISATVDALGMQGDEESRPRHIRALREEVDRLARLTKRLLDYGEVRPPDASEQNVADLVERAVARAASDSAARRTPVAIRLPGDLPPVRAERDALVQSIAQLLDNALRYAPEGGSVTLEAGREGAEVWIAVSDDGAGFRPGDLPRVFDPFFTTSRGHSGLGLSIVQRLIESLGGGVVAENRAEGGARVVLRLPSSPQGGNSDT